MRGESLWGLLISHTGETLSWCSWRLIDLGGREFRQSNNAWRTQPFANQTTAAHHVPDQEHPERRDCDQAGSEQDGDGSANARPSFRTLIEQSPQPASRRSRLPRISVREAITIAVTH
jgi:hypothetical protein